MIISAYTEDKVTMSGYNESDACVYQNFSIDPACTFCFGKNILFSASYFSYMPIT